MITDQLMLDVLRSATTTPGELCVVTTFTTKMHKSPVSCSDLGDFCVLFLLNRTNQSCIVNRQIGVVDSKYWVVGDPLFSGHVIQPNFSSKIAYNWDNECKKNFSVYNTV